MEITEIYALCAGGVFVAAALFRIRSHLVRLAQRIVLLYLRYIVYPQLLPRYRFLGPWSRADVLLQLAYLAVNAFCVAYRATSIRMSGVRAGNLAVIHLASLTGGPHLAFLADVFDMSLSNYRRLHRSLGVMSALLFGFHVLVMVTDQGPSIYEPKILWGTIGASSFGLLLVGSHPIFRAASYEFFLRMHHALAAAGVFFLWRHLVSPSLTLFYAIPIMFLSTFLLQCAVVLYRNLPSGCRAHVRQADGDVQIVLNVPRPVKLDAGQYVNLWIPSVSFWSFFQSHPFVVTSWSAQEQSHLQMYSKPRQGWTLKLLDCSRADPKGTLSRMALFSGPHGKTAKVSQYETVLMVASGYGMATQLPYLRQFIYGYNTCKTHTRRVHLVWEIDALDVAVVMTKMLNSALDAEMLDDGYSLKISVFVKQGAKRTSFGLRAVVEEGRPNFKTILEDEASGKHLSRTSGEGDARGRMLVLVSAKHTVRDELRALMCEPPSVNVEMKELEYQPDETL